MAKKSKSRDRTREVLASLPATVRSIPRLREVQDFRTFDFEPATRPARLFTGATATVGVTSNKKSTQKKGRARVPYQLAFTAPRLTLVCVRRKRRKEVLFAKNKAGRRGQKKPRRSAWSNIKC